MLTSYKSFLFILLTFVTALKADITITVDNLQVKLSPLSAWTVSEIKRNGLMVCDGTLSGQGTALIIDSNSAGSVHGNEQVLDAYIIVDGQKQPLQDTLSYDGDTIVFYRRTALADAYILNSTMTISHERIDEEISLQGYNETITCTTVYGFMGSRMNRFTDYAAIGTDNTIVASGQTITNYNKETFLPPSIAVGQYDPVAGECSLTVSSYGEELGLTYFIWDRWVDNKLYSKYLEMEGACSLSNYFKTGQTILFFDSIPEDWKNIALSLVKSIRCSGRRQGDLNKDCKIDFADLAIIAQNWIQGADIIPQAGDFDGSGRVDISDLSFLVTIWLKNSAVADIAPPPDGDGIVNFIDLALFARHFLEGT